MTHVASTTVSTTLRRLVAAAVIVAAAAPGALAAGTITRISTAVSGTGTSQSGGGAWSWFSDSRAVVDNGKLLSGWVTTNGFVQTSLFDLTSSTNSITTLNNGNKLEPGGNDHDYPSFVKHPDGYYTAFYGKHSANNSFPMYQTATAPASNNWSTTLRNTGTNVLGFQFPSNNTGAQNSSTYVNPYVAPWDPTGNTVINFWRGGNFNPTLSTATYNPATKTLGNWTAAQNFILDPSQNNQRPYVKYASNKTDRIGFLYTDGHPAETNNNNVYFAYIAKDPANGGALSYFKPGQAAAIKTVASGSITPAQGSRIHADTNTGSPTGNSWVWDVAYTASGNPVVAYSVAGSGSIPREEYRWAMFDGTSWIVKVLVADAGGPITRSTNQQFYAGGIALDPTNPYVVYVSAQTNPNVTSSKFKISQMKLNPANPAGAILSAMDITDGTVDAMRPIVPEDHAPGLDMVMYMSGEYYNYANFGAPQYNAGLTNGTGYGYSTTINLWTNVVPEPSTLGMLAIGGIALLRRRR